MAGITPLPIPEEIEEIGHRVIGCGINKSWEIPGHRLDLMVAGCVIVELKAESRLAEVHRLQVLSYLKATGLRLGFVMNFNVEVLKHGTKRVVL